MIDQCNFKSRHQASGLLQKIPSFSSENKMMLAVINHDDDDDDDDDDDNDDHPCPLRQ